MNSSHELERTLQMVLTRSCVDSPICMVNQWRLCLLLSNLNPFVVDAIYIRASDLICSAFRFRNNIEYLRISSDAHSSDPYILITLKAIDNFISKLTFSLKSWSDMGCGCNELFLPASNPGRQNDQSETSYTWAS